MELLGGLATLAWSRPKHGSGGQMIFAGDSTFLRENVYYKPC